MSDVTGPADSLHYRFLGMSFASPIVLLSGCVGFGEEYTRVEGFSNNDCGAVVLKARPSSRDSAIRRTGYSKPPWACSMPSACKTRAPITW